MGKKIFKLFLAMFLCFASITGNIVAETENQSPASCNLYYANNGADGIEVQCPSGVLDSFTTIMVSFYGGGEGENPSFTIHSEENIVVKGGFDENGHKFVISREELASRLGDIPAGEYNVYMSVYDGVNPDGNYVNLDFDGTYTYPEKGADGNQDDTQDGNEGGSGDGPQGPSFRMFYANGSNTPDGFEIQGPSSAFKNCVQIQVYFTDVNDSEKVYPYTVSDDIPKVHPQNENITLITVSQQDINADENWPKEMTTGKYNVTLRLYTKENPDAPGPATQTNYSLPFAQGTFEYVNYPGKNACVLRAVDVTKDADLIGSQNIAEGFVVDCGNNTVFTSVDSYNVEFVSFELSNSDNSVNFNLPNGKYLMNETKLLMPKENMPLIDTTIPSGTYAVNMKLTLRKGAVCPPSVAVCPFERTYVTYAVSDEYTFETNHKQMPDITMSADDEGVKFKCAGAACREWANTLSVNADGNSSVRLVFNVNGSNTGMDFANTADDRSSVLFTGAGDGVNYTIVIPKEKMLPYGIPEGISLNFIQVAVYGYKSFTSNGPLELPFSSPSVDASKILVKEVIGSDGEPELQIISSDTSEEYETWMKNIDSLKIEGTSRTCGLDPFEIQRVDNQLMISIPQTNYGFLQEVHPMKLLIYAAGYINVTKEIELQHLYSDFTPKELSIDVKASGLEIHVTGKESGDWLKALTVFRESEKARPYVMLTAENMGKETIVKLMNQSAEDTVLSLNHLTASDENHDDNTKYTLLIPMNELIKHVDEFKAGNTPVVVRPAPYQYVANKMVNNVPVYPMVKLVSETQDATKNDGKIDTEVLDELDGYLTGNQITNVTVMVNNDDLRKNGSSKVELKGALTAMIVSDAEGNYTVNDLNQDSVSMNMSTTIDEVKLTEDQIQEYVETLMETANEMQTVYDNFGFDIKLHKEDKEMKDLAVATAITFELPEAIEVKDGETLVLLTVHNGTAKYLPVVVMTDANGNRTGIAYTSEFSSFIPVVLKADSTVDVETKVEAEKLTTVPEELVSKYETVEKLEEKMITVLNEKSSISKENTAVYDVVLMVTFDGVNYVEADETHWPADGKIHVVLPYPTGTDKSFEFTVAHMFTKNLFGKKAGDIEYPAVTLTDNGIEFDVTGLSPVSLGWKKEVKPTPTPDAGISGPVGSAVPEPEQAPSVPDTSDDSNLLGWSFVAILSLCLMLIATVQRKKQLMKQ